MVKPVKKIAALLSHTEYLFEIKIRNSFRYKVTKRFRDFDSLNQVVSFITFYKSMCVL